MGLRFKIIFRVSSFCFCFSFQFLVPPGSACGRGYVNAVGLYRDLRKTRSSLYNIYLFSNLTVPLSVEYYNILSDVTSKPTVNKEWHDIANYLQMDSFFYNKSSVIFKSSDRTTGACEASGWRWYHYIFNIYSQNSL